VVSAVEPLERGTGLITNEHLSYQIQNLIGSLLSD